MPTRADHATLSDPTTAISSDTGASTRPSVWAAVVLAVLALVAIAVGLTLSGPDAGISPAADAGISSTSDTDDVPDETRARNRGVFE